MESESAGLPPPLPSVPLPVTQLSPGRNSVTRPVVPAADVGCPNPFCLEEACSGVKSQRPNERSTIQYDIRNMAPIHTTDWRKPWNFSRIIWSDFSPFLVRFRGLPVGSTPPISDNHNFVGTIDAHRPQIIQNSHARSTVVWIKIRYIWR